jgi:MSHA biogenesis protein MshN
MSIINRMLQDLDRRHGMSDTDAMPALSQVRTVAPARKDREWFWRTIALLMIAAVGWVGWIAWQLRPRDSVATEQAFKASQDAQRNRAAVAMAAAVPERKPAAATPATENPPAAESEKPASQAAGPSTPAQSTDAPTREPARPAPKEQVPARATAHAAPPPAPAARPAMTELDLDVPPARILPVPARAQRPVRVEKRDLVRTPEDRAEGEFRRGAGLLTQGRAVEAEDAFGAALAAYPAHEAARQALVAMDLEQHRVDDARRLLQEGVALNPGNARFASVLAQIYAERKDYPAALEVLNRVQLPGQESPEIQSLRGAVLQKLGRHAEAADAFRASLRSLPQNGAGWMGLGISLEALGRRAEAAEAFRRAAAAGTLSAEVRSYAEERARQLK